MTMLRLTWLLLAKDVRIAARSREVLGFMLLFAMLCVVVFAFGFLREGQAAQDQVPGVLWVTLLFTGTVGLLRLFAPEEEAGNLDLVARTLSGTAPLFWSKAALQLLFSGIVTAFLLPIVAVFFDASLHGLEWIALALVLGLIGQAALGTLAAALLAQVRLREALLPLVLYPLLAPLVLGGVKVTALALTRAPYSAFSGWIELMLAFDAVVVVLSPWLFARVTD
ncbi:MAG: heme exporter protein CcmB [Deltaproteobacteria bacterium]|nr:heme exporter protein CcmB [Deltaproteobacteria bacterium]